MPITLDQLARDSLVEGSRATSARSCLASSRLQCDVATLAAILLTTIIIGAVTAITYYSSCSKSGRARYKEEEEEEEEDSTTAAAARSGGVHSLPSPTPLLPRWFGFIGGHTLQIAREEMVQQLEGWADEFGGNYELSLFGKKMVVFTDAANCRRILTLRPSKFGRGLTPTQFQWAADKLGFTPSMFFDEGKQWGRGRRLIAPFLNGHNVTGMIPIMSKIGERFCAKLGAQAENGEVIEATEAFTRFTHDVIALTAFGFDANSMGATKERPCKSYDSMAVIFDSLMALVMQPLAMLGWVTLRSILPWVRQAKHQSMELQIVIQGVIDDMRRKTLLAAEAAATSSDEDSSSSSSSDSCGGTLLRKCIRRTGGEAKTKSDRMRFSDEEVVRHVKTLFIAGTETTALTLSWAIYFLAVNPHMVARCRKEALTASPGTDGMVSTNEQLSQLQFCRAVFQETLRLRGASTFQFFNCLESTTMGSGMVLEKGTGVITLIRYTSLSEDAFTRAADFVPERWIEAEREEALLGEGVKSSGGRVRHDDKAFLGFGAGPRVCPGQDMAKVEASVIIAALCARYDIALAPGQDDPPEEVHSFTSGPKSVRVVLTKATA